MGHVLNLGVTMRLLKSSAALPLVLAITACPSLSSMPDSNIKVLGFATNCGKGATALITQYDRMSDDPEPGLAIEKSSLRPGDAEVTLGFQSRNRRLPFVARIDQITHCVFASSDPVLLIEANCYKDLDPLPRCQARLNLQGLRDAPDGYITAAYPPEAAPGQYPSTPPEHLFDETDLKAANDRERERIGSAMDFTTEFLDEANRAQQNKASEGN